MEMQLNKALKTLQTQDTVNAKMAKARKAKAEKREKMAKKDADSMVISKADLAAMIAEAVKAANVNNAPATPQQGRTIREVLKDQAEAIEDPQERHAFEVIAATAIIGENDPAIKSAVVPAWKLREQRISAETRDRLVEAGIIKPIVKTIGYIPVCMDRPMPERGSRQTPQHTAPNFDQVLEQAGNTLNRRVG